MYLLNLLAVASSELIAVYLHSTMYLLNLRNSDFFLQHLHDLHSTMYLLNRIELIRERRQLLYLHSTMYLLNLEWFGALTPSIIFTFHYVSIKSN